MLGRIKQLVRKLMDRYDIVNNVNKTHYEKNCLILYITNPFRNKTINEIHQNQWQAKELARIIGTFGYNVDVIRYDNSRVTLNKNYDLVVDLHPGLNKVYWDHMNEECIKIAYVTGSNPTFYIEEQEKRINGVKQRKGKALIMRRVPLEFSAKLMESFNAMFFIGNEYNFNTYNQFQIRKVFFIKNNGYFFNKRFSINKKKANNFLFFASGGQVAKGLDLLLDIFSEEDFECNLYICSSFSFEKDFCELYHEEMYNRKNIIPIGFVDIKGEEFKRVVEICSFVIMPSCSEGIAGSILNGMSAGLIPIVSKECGLELDEVFYFDDCSIECIKEAIQFYSKKDLEWIQRESEKALKIVQERYSKECFSNSVTSAMHATLRDNKS